jgi:Coenzyme PQQ synthesis protein D (PqqD)
MLRFLEALVAQEIGLRTNSGKSGFPRLEVRQSRNVKCTMFSISKSVRLTKSRDGGILLDMERGGIFSLNPVATRVIELLGREQSVSSLVDQISHEFGISERLAPDVVDFLSTLRDERMLEDSEGNPPPQR